MAVSGVLGIGKIRKLHLESLALRKVQATKRRSPAPVNLIRPETGTQRTLSQETSAPPFARRRVCSVLQVAAAVRPRLPQATARSDPARGARAGVLPRLVSLPPSPDVFFRRGARVVASSPRRPPARRRIRAVSRHGLRVRRGGGRRSCTEEDTPPPRKVTRPLSPPPLLRHLNIHVTGSDLAQLPHCFSQQKLLSTRSNDFRILDCSRCASYLLLANLCFCLMLAKRVASKERCLLLSLFAAVVYSQCLHDVVLRLALISNLHVIQQWMTDSSIRGLLCALCSDQFQ
jgi:hypothetical protein